MIFAQISHRQLRELVDALAEAGIPIPSSVTERAAQLDALTGPMVVPTVDEILTTPAAEIPNLQARIVLASSAQTPQVKHAMEQARNALQLAYTDALRASGPDIFDALISRADKLSKKINAATGAIPDTFSTDPTTWRDDAAGVESFVSLRKLASEVSTYAALINKLVNNKVISLPNSSARFPELDAVAPYLPFFPLESLNSPALHAIPTNSLPSAGLILSMARSGVPFAPKRFAELPDAFGEMMGQATEWLLTDTGWHRKSDLPADYMSREFITGVAATTMNRSTDDVRFDGQA